MTPVFLSWSGERSKAIALALNDWIPLVLQAADPWYSEQTEAGTRWSAELARRLADSKIGILCLTPENLHADWLLFEAGALAKTLGDDTRVIPYLSGLKLSDVSPPLSQFQMKTADEEGTFGVVQAINRQLSPSLRDDRLRNSFEAYWPKLQGSLKAIPPGGSRANVHERGPTELLEEILATVRDLARRPIESQSVSEVARRHAVLRRKRALDEFDLAQVRHRDARLELDQASARDGVPAAEIERLQQACEEAGAIVNARRIVLARAERDLASLRGSAVPPENTAA